MSDKEKHIQCLKDLYRELADPRHLAIRPWIYDDLEALDEGIKSLENRKTGHWRFQKREGHECVYRCSNCGRKITKYDEFYDFERLFAYCPECGAKMEGE